MLSPTRNSSLTKWKAFHWNSKNSHIFIQRNSPKILSLLFMHDKVNNSAVSLIGFYHDKISVQLTQISVKTKYLHSSLLDKYSNTSGKIEWLIVLTQGQFELISMIQKLLKFSKISFWEFLKRDSDFHSLKHFIFYLRNCSIVIDNSGYWIKYFRIIYILTQKLFFTFCFNSIRICSKILLFSPDGKLFLCNSIFSDSNWIQTKSILKNITLPLHISEAFPIAINVEPINIHYQLQTNLSVIQHELCKVQKDCKN